METNVVRITSQPYQSVTSSEVQTVAHFPFTTLEGLYQALEMLSHERPDIRRGEIYVQDRNGNPLGALVLKQTKLSDGSYTLDATFTSAK